MPVKGTPLHVPPCLFFISGCSPFKVASGRALASAVRNTYCGQGFSAHQGRQSSAHARSIRARHWAPRVSAGYPECFESISKKASPFPAKAGNRDSIRSKVFEEDGGGLEGEGETFSESFPFPPPMFYSPPSFSECSFLKMVLRLTLKTSATFWTDPCTLRALRRMPRSMSAMMSLRGRS